LHELSMRYGFRSNNELFRAAQECLLTEDRSKPNLRKK
jgi:hypothetical protein